VLVLTSIIEFFEAMPILEHLPLLSRTRLVLASASPRRAELLKQVKSTVGGRETRDTLVSSTSASTSRSPLRAALPPSHTPQVGLRHFEVLPSTFDETLDKAAFPSGADYAVATARAKGAEVAARVRAGMGSSSSQAAALIVAADTVVQAPDGTILEKPDGGASAAAMLASLSSAVHSVHTGVSLVYLPGTAAGSDAAGPGPAPRATFREFSETTAVTFAPLSPAEIEAYVAGGEGEGKAGGYGIQGPAGAWVSHLEGCYFNVVGLPLHALARELAGLVEAGVLV